MLRSDDRILTTHTGSLPRPRELVQALLEGDQGGAAADSAQVREAVAGIVRAQNDAGVDVVNDGEASKIGYSTYVRTRLTGFDGETQALPMHDFDEVPEYAVKLMGDALGGIMRPACTSDVAYIDTTAVEEDIANLQAAVDTDPRAAEAFLTAASPGVISVFLGNLHYPDHEAYLAALADAMKQEYDAIHAAGLLLQVDCPDLAMSMQMFDPVPSVEEFRRRISQNVEALNHALRDIPADRVRLHLCWGNYEGPHRLDIPLRDILDIVLTANVGALSFEAANCRHEHEWNVFQDIKLPDDKVILPGVIDSTTNYVEHPELVAQRLIRYAEVVGRERVIGSSDCGFATFAAYEVVDPVLTWAKLRSMSEGAALASQQLW